MRFIDVNKWKSPNPNRSGADVAEVAAECQLNVVGANEAVGVMSAFGLMNRTGATNQGSHVSSRLGAESFWGSA
jgi:hypothetical protein